MSSSSAKSQVVQHIKDATNILVAVSRDPSVDELSAALGITLFLNVLGKHATAVFSGKTPPAIDFLQPEGTFEDTADSLRDFIIALDKEKADHLRYKVVDDAVKIFITPYKTTISEADLEFSQGDYNVELVIGLNVADNDHLDEALAAHGRILHDATVLTVTSGEVRSTLGTTDWHDAKASGVSEMLAELVDELKTPKAVMDEQIATALLTGIVAATDRFSGPATSSRVMTVAAGLMAAGANQQLIATRLQEAAEAETTENEATEMTDAAKDTEEMSEAEEVSTATNEEIAAPSSKQGEYDGSLSIRHNKTGTVDDVARQTQAERQDEAARAAEAHLAKRKAGELSPTTEVASAEGVSTGPAEESAAAPSEPDLAAVLSQPVADAAGPVVATSPEPVAAVEPTPVVPEPTVTMSAPAAHREYIAAPMPGEQPLNAAMVEDASQPPKVDPFAVPPTGDASAGAAEVTAIAPLTPESSAVPVAPQTGAAGADALSPEVTPIEPATPVSDEILSALQADTMALAQNTTAALPQGMPHAPVTASLTPAQPPLPPLPDFSTLPPVPPAPLGVDANSLPSLPTMPPQPATQFDPAQFQIPGQQG